MTMVDDQTVSLQPDEPAEPEAPRLFDSLDLVALSTAVSCACVFMAYTMRSWKAGFIEHQAEVWLAIQDVLAAHNHVGEKDRTHPLYLRGTIYCSSCGARLVCSQNTGNGGTYQYFMCLKRKTKQNNCHRPAVRLERIEDGIAGFYANFHLPPERAEQIREAVREELASQQDEAARSLQHALKRKERVQGERQKLLQAHYAGIVPQDLLASEMKRLTRELAESDTEIAAAKASSSHVETTLTAALTAAGNCQAAYLTAPDHVRRQINQGFFEKLFIGEDGTVERSELTEPFAALLDRGDPSRWSRHQPRREAPPRRPRSPQTRPASRGRRTTPWTEPARPACSGRRTATKRS